MSIIEYLSDNEMLEEQGDIEKTQKRMREESESEWTTVGQSKEKKLKENEKIEVYISSKEKLPKQFTLAKIFKDQNITDIIRVKYLNPFKVRVDLISEISAQNLKECQYFKDKNWRIQKALERNFSYGTIRDVDLDLTNEKIVEKIRCDQPAQLISAYRLSRRNLTEPGWIPSETVRLCFKGSFIPSYVYVEELRVKVESYEFPVTQCSRCWKFGHRKVRCPSLKIVCPKCAKNHENCENTTFKCVNCLGNHMALSKVCPKFLKEKKLRSLMSEFNCTYRKAFEIYVPPEINDLEEERKGNEKRTSNTSTYAGVTKKKKLIKTSKQIKKQYSENIHPQCAFNNNAQSDSENMEDNHCYEKKSPTRNSNDHRAKDFNIGELLRRLKEIIFLRGVTVRSKVVAVFKCCIEWIIITVVENVSEWPILKLLLDYLQHEND
ncbi:unnamed protein product [Euphydryas editha]|uniref:Reverse transcriptase n=1 Tax=Euphydryas editha TaxID=104508 RepID=A0AAU9UMP0_EUPED|nr:unnamed protein product [Euphydryas editha]